VVYLSEHFYSIQGEGKFSGVPSIFFRFGGCNLRCEGFKTEYTIDSIKKFGCDSFYSVDQGFKNSWQTINRLDDFLSILSQYPKGVKDIILTGGEPLIYADNPIFIDFIKYLKEEDYRITIETNGTIEPQNIDIFRDINYSIALKLSNSGENFNKRFNLDAIHSIINLSKDSFFKFTIDRDSIKKGIGMEIERIHKTFPNTPIYCMPIGKDEKELEENGESVVNLCLERGYIYSDRIHIRIWNGKRGY